MKKLNAEHPYRWDSIAGLDALRETRAKVNELIDAVTRLELTQHDPRNLYGTPAAQTGGYVFDSPTACGTDVKDLEFITDPSQMVGRTIAKINFSPLRNKVMIQLADGQILLLVADNDYDGMSEIEVGDRSDCSPYELHSFGLITTEDLDRMLAEAMEKSEKANRQRELRLLNELKKKYEAK